MPDNTDLRIGQKYGIWTIIEDTGKLTRYGEKIYKALSDYGRERVVWRSHIEGGGPGYPVNVLNNQTNLERKRVKKKIHKRKKRKILIFTTAITKEKLEVPIQHDISGRSISSKMVLKINKHLTEEVLKKEYNVLGKSLIDIAKEYNCTRQYIFKLLKKYGIPRRTLSEARIIAIERKKLKFEYHDIDEKFFSKWSPEMAWVLGLFFTDGCVSGGKVSLTSIDLGLLEKVKHHLKSTKSIAKHAQGYDKSKYIYIFEFYREKMREDLNKLGLTKRKSLTMIFPDIPEQYIRHFIRGCWDGDGSVYLEKRKDLDYKASVRLGKKVEYVKDIRLGVSFVSGSKEFIERIVLELYKVGVGRDRLIEPAFIKPREYLIKGLTIHRYPHKQARYIKMGGKKKCERLFHYFYDGVDESLYLKRKYEVFKKGLDLLKKKL